MKSLKHTLSSLALSGLIAAIALIGCKESPKGATQAAANTASANDSTAREPTIIRIAHTRTNVPYTYIDDKGASQGLECAIWQECVKLLPQYKIEFYPTSEEDLLLGVEEGKYDAAIKGIWETKERRAKYLFPKHSIAASVIGLTIRKEDEGSIHDMLSFANYSGKLVPISPQSAQYAIIEEWNSTHASSPIDLVAADSFNIPQSYPWLLEHRYDGFLDLETSYNKKVVAQDGAYHELYGKLSYIPYMAIPTWTIFNKSKGQLASDFDSALETLRTNKTYTKLSIEYLGKDISTLEAH